MPLTRPTRSDSMPQKKFQPQTAEVITHKRGRLRFTDFSIQRNPHGDCTVEVELEWTEGDRVRGRSSAATG